MPTRVIGEPEDERRTSTKHGTAIRAMCKITANALGNLGTFAGYKHLGDGPEFYFVHYPHGNGVPAFAERPSLDGLPFHTSSLPGS